MTLIHRVVMGLAVGVLLLLATTGFMIPEGWGLLLHVASAPLWMGAMLALACWGAQRHTATGKLGRGVCVLFWLFLVLAFLSVFSVQMLRGGVGGQEQQQALADLHRTSSLGLCIVAIGYGVGTLRESLRKNLRKIQNSSEGS